MAPQIAMVGIACLFPLPETEPTVTAQPARMATTRNSEAVAD